MAVEVQVPVGGEGVEEYVLARWHATTGARVTDGEALFEIETAKATYDVPSPADGVLTITIPEGNEVTAHQVIGTIADTAGKAATVDALPPPAAEGASSAAPAPAVGSASDAVDCATSGEPDQTDRTGGVERTRIAASPRARSAARAAGVDLTGIAGTGPGGRVLARDVPAPHEPVPRADRAVIARRMTEAAAVPAVTLHRWCRADALQALVARLREHGDRWEIPRITVGDVLALVVSRVLLRHPDLNAHWVDRIQRRESVDLGVAVDAPWGLVVPVVHDAQCLSLSELSSRLADLADRARARIIARDEITGSTFTLTNLGPTGVEHFTPLLNPPEVAILGVGALVERDGAVCLPLSLTFDHRAVDGAPAGRFLADVAAGIETADVLLALQEGRPR